ncbi:Nucleoside-diphosphate-sugar epimerase [Tangfeifania diversioriginum]|uniref:Nucleoside-diphosphate-sugar epimerase n=1 Tax=Tangfeifania diversioriginum TaxID=1168035 RepID=A0A1M6A7R2_9BACT|nr:SDR family oxidoreductase [Tangfeifania diversioriginum]SHI32518.1 Nucleoside-diphosphate-sugar epimerase [Tangfeifania diversioriginum]
MQKIVINGANGFVASHFIRELLEQNFEVIALVRNGENLSAQQRMQQVLEEISEKKGVDFSKLKVYSYSLFDENYSLTQEQIDTIFDGNIQFFHFAASLKFSAKDKNTIFETNVDGLKNSVQFFQKYAKPDSRFIYMSTAYSCGKFSGVFEEKFYPEEEKSHFRNYYEQSKRVAENVMMEHIESGRLNGHVVRLSQVVGNNKTGVTKTNYGIFDLAKRLYNISSLHPNNTLRIKVDPDGTQNLIAIDKVVEALMNLLKINDLPQIINLTAKKGVKNETIAECINRNLPMKIILDKNLQKTSMNSLERMIAVGMSFTGKYTGINLQFAHENLDKIMISENNEITKHSLCKMMDYFMGELADSSSSLKNSKTNS